MTSNTLLALPEKLRAIETRYDGQDFRSRQEARFAVLLNALSVPYIFEKEGYYLGLGNDEKYLPDFWIEEAQAWVEIKGRSPTAEEFSKSTKLALIAKRPVTIFWGPYRHQSFIYNNFVFYQDLQGVFHSQRGRAQEFLGCQFYLHSSLLAALTKARQARFEHGESG